MALQVPQIFLSLLVIAAGTAVQASIGFGLALIAAPLLFLIDPLFVPGPVIASALVLSLWIVRQERQALDFRHFPEALAGRLIGSPLGAVVIGTLSAVTFDLVFALLVLLAVGMSLLHGNIQPNRRNVFLGMLASGFMGTISSIGGPPIALVYQNSNGARLRGNLSLMFLIGTLVSLVSLSVVGRFGPGDFQHTALLILGVVIGVFLARPLKKKLDRHNARPFLLVLCSLSAGVVLIQALLQIL